MKTFKSAQIRELKLSPKMRERIHNTVFVIPSIVTMAAFFSGFLGVLYGIRGEFDMAVKCIACAFILDGLDGRVARKLNATTQFGKEFDSLSDEVAFGIAPAIILYKWGLESVMSEFGVLIAFIFAVCGAARLARFNITTSSEPKKHFEGLPIPGAAAALISLVYFHPAPITGTVEAVLVAILMVLIAVFMVSTLHFFSPKHLKFTQKNMRLTLLACAVCVALAYYALKPALVIFCLGYALSAPVTMLYDRYIKKQVVE